MSGLPSRYAKCKKCMKGSYPTTFLDLWNFLLCLLGNETQKHKNPNTLHDFQL